MKQLKMVAARRSNHSKTLSFFKIPVFPNLWMQAISCLLAVLKCTDVLEISWIIVALPLWISLAIATSIFTIFFAGVGAIAAIMLAGSIVFESFLLFKRLLEKLRRKDG